MTNPDNGGPGPLEYQKLSLPGPDRPGRRVSWGALLAGATAAAAVQVLLMMLGTALGFAVFSPREGENPLVRFGYGAMAVHTVCAWLALAAGGWVAGHFTPVAARVHAWLHGFTVWAILMAAGSAAVTLGAGKLAGGLASAVGDSVSGLAKVAAPVVGAAAGEARKNEGDIRATWWSFADDVSPIHEGEQAPRKVSPKARRELVAAIARRYGPMAEQPTDSGKKELADAVTAAGLSPEEASKTVEDWDRFTARAREDLEAFRRRAEDKAREAADAASRRLAVVSAVAFVAFLLGAVAAGFGACCGAKCAKRCEEKCSA